MESLNFENICPRRDLLKDLTLLEEYFEEAYLPVEFKVSDESSV
jgi:hypothetical protein